MDVKLVYSLERTDNRILRTLLNGQRALIVTVPWHQHPLDTYRQVEGELSEAERVALAGELHVNPLQHSEDGPA
jgi:hypothetical protein